MHWEPLRSDKFDIWRAAVPGGWLVIANAVRSWHEASDFAKLITPELRRLETILLRMEDTDRASRIVFLPDPEHRWDGTSPAVAPAARIT